MKNRNENMVICVSMLVAGPRYRSLEETIDGNLLDSWAVCRVLSVLMEATDERLAMLAGQVLEGNIDGEAFDLLTCLDADMPPDKGGNNPPDQPQGGLPVVSQVVV